MENFDVTQVKLKGLGFMSYMSPLSGGGNQTIELQHFLINYQESQIYKLAKLNKNSPRIYLDGYFQMKLLFLYYSLLEILFPTASCMRLMKRP